MECCCRKVRSLNLSYAELDHCESSCARICCVRLQAEARARRFYKSGVMDKKCGTQLDHGVLLVGYGTENGKDYWKAPRYSASNEACRVALRRAEGQGEIGYHQSAQFLLSRFAVR